MLRFPQQSTQECDISPFKWMSKQREQRDVRQREQITFLGAETFQFTMGSKLIAPTLHPIDHISSNWISSLVASVPLRGRCRRWLWGRGHRVMQQQKSTGYPSDTYFWIWYLAPPGYFWTLGASPVVLHLDLTFGLFARSRVRIPSCAEKSGQNKRT